MKSNTLLIRQAQLINEGQEFTADVFVEDGRIAGIDSRIRQSAATMIDGTGKWLIPGIIDDQVHFREPGLTHKAEIATEARAAVAGGVTSFMEMPNTKPPALTQALLEEKYRRAALVSPANYSFFMGVSNDNLQEVLNTNPRKVCGIKIFMGSSTGNLLVDNRETLEALFAQAPTLIATHCEDEATVRRNEAMARETFGEEVPMEKHPDIRSVEACYASSSLAVALAKQYNTRLHILHISTLEELALFDHLAPLKEKRITAEVCVHHLSFTAEDYATHGGGIKCNPAIKAPQHREALWAALRHGKLDIIATDHAPHTAAEKANPYFDCPSGIPLVQHSLNLMLRAVQEGRITTELMVEKMCHAPADCFLIEKRGYLREGYHADMVLIDPEQEWTVAADNLHYKCGWSPLLGQTFKGKVETTIVNGHVVYDKGQFPAAPSGNRLLFER